MPSNFNDIPILNNSDYICRNLDCEEPFKPITFKVLPVDDTTSLSVSTSSGLCTWKFYSGGSLDAEYEANSVSHTWGSTADRYFELLPPDGDYGLIVGGIDWRGRGLFGEVPDSFYKLINLTVIRLANNFLSIDLYKAFDAFRNAIEFWSYNAFYNFSLPRNINNLKNCARLELSYSGGGIDVYEIPREIGDMESLGRLLLWGVRTLKCEITYFSSPVTYCDIRFSSIANPDEINNLAIALDNAGGLNGWFIVNGGSNASPTGAGITAVNNLIAKGWTVITN